MGKGSGGPMQQTWSANRAIALLEWFEVDKDKIAELIERGEFRAVGRHSYRLGFKHLLAACGIPWDEEGTGPTGAAERQDPWVVPGSRTQETQLTKEQQL